MTTTMKFTLCAARDGGIAVWLDGIAEPVFAGDETAYVKYAGERAKELVTAAAKQKAEEAKTAAEHMPLEVTPLAGSRRALNPKLADRLLDVEAAE